jgi:predicted ester cyclase
MTNIEVLKAVFAAFEARDAKKVDELLANDFTISGPTPEPIGKPAFVGLQLGLVAAMPDWKFNASDFKEEGDKVLVKLHISGTQTAALSIPPLGIQSFAASGKHVQLPYEQLTVTIKNGKVTRLDVGHVDGGGVPGVLAQIGAPVPAH